jgi:hypothetical protein
MGTTGKIFIYGLYDPRDREVRYIGKTTTGVYRINRHRNESSRRRLTGDRPSQYCQRWVDKIASDGYPFEWFVVSYSTKESLCDDEKSWIGFFKDMGCRLTNMTAGGDGGGFARSAETRRKSRQSNVVTWSDPVKRAEHAERTRQALSRPDVVEKMKASAIATGIKRRGSKNPMSLNTRMLISKALKGKNVSEETRRRLSIAKKGKPSGRRLSDKEIQHLQKARWPIQSSEHGDSV